MPTTDPRVDAYLASIAPWQAAILQRMRGLIHQACPGVTETMKRSRPAFDYKGVLCGMSGFKRHCSVGFWKERVLEELPGGHADVLRAVGKMEEGATPPSDAAILELLREAVRLNEENVRVPKAIKPTERKQFVMPPDFEQALRGHGPARAVFENFSPSAQREYLEWLAEAKTEATRAKRLATAVEWIGEGKRRHWKYQTKK